MEFKVKELEEENKQLKLERDLTYKDMKEYIIENEQLKDKAKKWDLMIQEDPDATIRAYDMVEENKMLNDVLTRNKQLKDNIKSNDILCDVYVKEINRLEQELKDLGHGHTKLLKLFSKAEQQLTKMNEISELKLNREEYEDYNWQQKIKTIINVSDKVTKGLKE